MGRAFARLRRAGPVGVAAWFAVMLALGAGLLAKHVVALPLPAKSTKLEASLRSLRHADEEHQWVAFHVLYATCRCSQRVVLHLTSTHRPADYAEIVLWVGDEAPPGELAERFDVRRISEEDLGRFGIEAAPMLVAVDPDGHVRYAGGYSERKQGPELEDLRLLRAAKLPGVVAAFPLFGCAVSDRLKEQLARLPSL
jgi:hypothetical protein